MAYNLISLETNGITCYANGTITAGDFVKAVANNDSVTSSGVSSFDGSADIKIERADASGDEETVIGIAANAASSAGKVDVKTAGLFIVRAGEAIAAGKSLQKADSTDYLEVEVIDDGEEEFQIGKALTSASAADKYIVMLLRV